MIQKYYAVRKGKKTGIFNTWNEAKAQVHGFKGAEYKSFTSLDEAKNYLTPKVQKEISSESLVAYVDGSFSKDQGRYSYGIVLLQNGKILKKMSNVDNNERYVESFQIAGECFGCIRAMYEGIQMGFKEIYIHYDYVGIEKWALGEWRANKAVSKDYIEYFNKYSEHINVYFTKVKAHTGVEMNELADQLAKDALRKV